MASISFKPLTGARVSPGERSGVPGKSIRDYRGESGLFQLQRGDRVHHPLAETRIFGAHEALPRGGGKLRFCRITIVVGEPLRFTAADVEGRGREVYPRLSQRVMDAIAALQLE